MSGDFREYLKTNTETEFGGIETTDGYIAEMVDNSSGLTDDVMTKGGLLTIRGYGLKIEGDEAHKQQVGFFFEPEDSTYAAVKAYIIAVNEPRTLKVIVPTLRTGKNYALKIITQSPAKGGGTMLKHVREVLSEYTLTAQS